jgi:hypothetical protein
MSISFQGNTPDYKLWVFDIDGKTFVARNASSQAPLRIRFSDGRFYGGYTISQIAPGATLVKNTGFDIITGTSQDIDQAGIVKTGIVEWTWAGQKYRNRWNLIEGTELSPAIPEEGVAATFAFDLDIAPPYTPYDGPAGGSVGTGIASPAVVNAMTKDQREAAEAAAATTQITPAAQLSTAAPTQASPTPATTTEPPKVGTGITVPSNKTKEDIEASAAYKTYAYSNQTPVRTSTPQTPVPQAPVGMTKSPVVILGTKDAREAAAATAGPDWVKLALQVGAAYLLFS